MAQYSGKEFTIAISPTPTGWSNVDLLEASIEGGDRVTEQSRFGSSAQSEQVVATRRFARGTISARFNGGGNVTAVLTDDTTYTLTIREASGDDPVASGPIVFVGTDNGASALQGDPSLVVFSWVGSHTDSAQGWGVD